jgi:HK97 family phage major capsid protein
VRAHDSGAPVHRSHHPQEITPVEDMEKVALDSSATDEIATKVADALAPKTDPAIEKMSAEIAELKALLTTPNRPQRETAGIVEKSNEAPAYYGGDDAYTYTGSTDSERMTNLYLVSQLLSTGKKSLSARGREVMLKSGDKALRTAPEIKGDSFVQSMYGQMRAEAIKTAMTSTGAGTGDEWVPTFAAADLWRDVHLDTVVANQVNRVAMPTNPFDLPTESGDPTFYKAGTENVAVTASTPTTSKATLTAVKVQAEIDFSGELEEDSIIAVAPAIRSGIVRRAAQTIDDLIVHGDSETGGTGNVNSDDGAPTANSFYLSFSGMRKFCLVTNTGQVKSFGGAPTTALLLNTKSLLGRYGARPSDLVWVTGPSTYNALLGVTGFQLVSEYGQNATVIQGELGRIYNIPVVLSEAIPGTSTDKVDADGKYTTTTPASNDTKGWVLLFNKRAWVTGFRRDLQIETFRDIQKDMNILVCSFRMALIPSGISTIHTAVGYNITL